MEELTTIVRRERWLLGILLFRLTELRQLEAANEARFLPWAAAEVDDAIARVREADLMREALMTGTAVEGNAALWEHCDAILELLDEVHALRPALSLSSLVEFCKCA